MTKRRIFHLVISVLDIFPQALLLRFNHQKKLFNNIYGSKKSQKEFQQREISKLRDDFLISFPNHAP